MNIAQHRRGMTIEEFVRRYSEAPFEMVDGVTVPIATVLAGRNRRGRATSAPMHTFGKSNEFGEVYFETPYVVMSGPYITGVRVPDLMLYSHARLEAYRAGDFDWHQKPFRLVPELCIDIVTPQEPYGDVISRVTRFLMDGVRLFWLVNQAHHTVVVYRRDSIHQTTLGIGDTLSGEHVLPGFLLDVDELFG